MSRLVATSVLMIVLSGCSGEGGELTDCEQAFATAAAEDEMHDSVEGMFPAVRVCGSLEGWDAAWDQYSEDLAFQGTSRSVLANMCLSPDISSEPLCQAVNE